MKRIFYCFLLLSISLTGCARSTPESFTVLTRITVIREYQGVQTQRIYTTSEKMSRILNILRSIGTSSSPDLDPEPLKLRCYTIILTRSDGSTLTYKTKGDRYIRKNDEAWQQTDPKIVSELNLLLQTLPSDEN